MGGGLALSRRLSNAHVTPNRREKKQTKKRKTKNEKNENVTFFFLFFSIVCLVLCLLRSTTYLPDRLCARQTRHQLASDDQKKEKIWDFILFFYAATVCTIYRINSTLYHCRKRSVTGSKLLCVCVCLSLCVCV